VQPIQPAVQSQQGPPVQIPFDARKTRFHLPDDNDDIVMAEPAKPRKAPKRNDRLDKLAQEQQAEFGRPKIVRRAEIASELQDQQVIKNILNTPVTLPMREVLASSKELSDQLSDMIKRKATVAPMTAQASSVPLRARAFLLEKSCGTLITLDVMCGNKPITAIIDTGSQLNVVSEECWKQAIRMPLDIKQTVAMNDANGGKGTLSGLVCDVPLKCGAVKTLANLYIGKNAPFDLLLGRPWQQDNRVCIDERKDGTYLQFKDQNTFQPRFEVLVNSERPGTDYGMAQRKILQVSWKVPQELPELRNTIASYLKTLIVC
jgi:hypothetical protein